MKKLVMLFGLFLLCLPAQSRDADALRQLADRTAILEVMQKYIWSADSLDADGYVSVFTEDAEVETNGTVLKGWDPLESTCRHASLSIL